jgi:hypothetical protein
VFRAGFVRGCRRKKFVSEPQTTSDPDTAGRRPPLPAGFPLAAAWLAFGFLCAIWPLARSFSGFTGVMIDAPAYVGLTALGIFVALLLVFVNLLRLRPGGIWLSISLAAIFAASGLLKLPALVSTGDRPGAIWVVGVASLLHIVVAVYLSRPWILAALERRRLG